MAAEKLMATTNPDVTALEGISIGIALTLVGLVLLALPSVIKMARGWRTASYVGALTSVGIGIGGMFLSLASLFKRSSFEDIGVSAMFFAFSGALLLCTRTIKHSLILVFLIYGVVAVFALTGVFGAGIGIAHYIAEEGGTSVVPSNNTPETPRLGVPPNGTTETPHAAPSVTPTPPDSLSRGEGLTIVVTLIVGILTAGATLAAPFLKK